MTYSFAENESDNSRIVIFVKRLDALLSLAPGRGGWPETTMLRPALTAIVDDEWIATGFRNAAEVALRHSYPEEKELTPETLWRVLVHELAERELLPDFCLHMMRDVLIGLDLGYEISLRRALQGILAVHGFEANLAD